MTAREATAGKMRRIFAALTVLAALTAAPRAGAQPGDGAPTTTPPEAQQKAEQHYRKARELYQTGSYREAAVELEAAHALDPNAKELVFNLGVVNEKLGKIDDALHYFRAYSQMDGVTNQEKEKASAFVRRLEGAKREIPPPPPPPPPDEDKRPPERGRIDAATISAASVAVVGLGVGTTFGVKALTDKPKAGYQTGAGKDGSYQDFVDARNRAKTDAVVCDVSLGVGVVAAAVATYLYVGRTKLAPPATRAQVSASPLPGGGALVVQGSF